MIPPWRNPTFYVVPKTRPNATSFVHSVRPSIKEVLECADMAHFWCMEKDFERARNYANAIPFSSQISLYGLNQLEKDAFEGFLIRTPIKDKVVPKNLSPDATLVFDFIQAVKQYVSKEESQVRQKNMAEMLQDLEKASPKTKEIQKTILFLMAKLHDHDIPIRFTPQDQNKYPHWFVKLVQNHPIHFGTNDVFPDMDDDDEDSLTEPSLPKRAKH